MIALRRIARRHTPTGLWVCVVLGFAAAAVAQTELSDGRPIDSLRHESGTSWVPLSAPHTGLRWRQGPWMLMLDTLTTAGVRGDGGLRGNEAAFGTNMLMMMASRPLGRGRLHVRAMSSFEPLMGADGHPLLLQTGETAAGVTPAIDRQHPHDLLMELGVEYAVDISPDAALFLGEALVGWSLFTRLSL